VGEAEGSAGEVGVLSLQRRDREGGGGRRQQVVDDEGEDAAAAGVRPRKRRGAGPPPPGSLTDRSRERASWVNSAGVWVAIGSRSSNTHPPSTA
jgi:hypothetical protein